MTSIVLAEYFTTIDNTLLFIGREDFKEPLVEVIPLTIGEIRQFVADNFGTTESQVAKVRNLDPDRWQKQFGPLVQPLLPYTKEGDTIWFVPHDVLHYLPLHALQVEGCALIERNPICYTPSASVMKFCHSKRKGKREKALVIGDSRNDLPYAREEALAIGNLFGTTPYLRNQATKSLVTKQLELEREQLDVLHFSCHGTFQFQQALKSGILLAPEPDPSFSTNPDDEQWTLTAEEIYRLSIKAELVTLSACETGVNEHKPGDELIGLTRALIYAGTPSVIVSLWIVDDLSTSLLMQHFYQQWRKQPPEQGDQQMTKAEALQSAQRYVKDLTAEQLLDYCTQQRKMLEETEDTESERKLTFALGSVYAHTIAGDFQQARKGYQQLQNQLATFNSARTRKLNAQVSRKLVTHKIGRSTTPDYNKRPFESMYYWAPFVLIGDWQ
jgi:CHAT domain-containing protein